MKLFFRIVSAIFSPLIVPCYGVAFALWTTTLCIVPLKARLLVVGMCMLLVCIIPAIAVFLLYKTGRITDPGLNERTDRTVPYCFTMGCYALATYYLFSIGAPLWLPGIMIGGLLTILVNLIDNFRWKISGHMAAMGGLIAVAMFITTRHLAVIPMLWPMIIVILLAGLVGTARLYLNRHTPLQVLAGTANGFICVYIAALAGWLIQV